MAIPEDLNDRQRQGIVDSTLPLLPNTSAGNTQPATVVVNPDGTFVGSGGGGGTVTANQGTPNTIGNSWPVEVTDGSNVLGVSAHPLRVDPTGTTTQPVSGSVSVSNFPGTQPVSGTVT